MIHKSPYQVYAYSVNESISNDFLVHIYENLDNTAAAISGLVTHLKRYESLV